ncbi:hypothetical protein [Methylobacterium sp. GC_Met_2]|nr:hypothetical protein [Methylobacterium sp. GC_Met_2]
MALAALALPLAAPRVDAQDRKADRSGTTLAERIVGTWELVSYKVED